MVSANISADRRKAIYRRDGFQCALCDSTKYLQIHHYIPRGQGGSDSPHNLITLCSDCHGTAHGILMYGDCVSREDVEQAMVEYLEDMYVEDWNPWRRE